MAGKTGAVSSAMHSGICPAAWAERGPSSLSRGFDIWRKYQASPAMQRTQIYLSEAERNGLPDWQALRQELDRSPLGH